MSAVHFQIVAHRGDKAHAPENTFPAFELAVACKADAIEASFGHGDRFKGTRIPRLDAFVETFLPRIQLQIEIKAPSATLPAVELLRRSGSFDRVMLTSFDRQNLIVAKKAEPRLRTGWLLSHDNHATVEDAKALGCTAIIPDSSRVNEEFVTRAHDIGLLIWSWGVDSLDCAERIIKAGADGGTYDDPGALVAFLRR